MDGPKSMIANGWRNSRWFVVALLRALASAVVPALCASGPPASRATGSAFDPTTSAVALRGRTQAVVRLSVTSDEGSAATPIAKATPLFASLPSAPLETGGAARQYPHPDSGRVAAPSPGIDEITRARPRAPPQAIS